MSNERTRTTKEVRDGYAYDGYSEDIDPYYELRFDRWLAAHDAEIRTAALKEAAGIAEHCLLIPDSDAEAYNEAVTDVISALRAARVVEHEHDPGGCTCGCPVADCADCGGAQ